MKKTFDFIKNRKLFYIISSAIIVVTILITAIFGLKVDIEFKGGSIATYSFTGETIDIAKAESTVKSAVGFSAKGRISNSTAGSSLVISISEEVSSEEQIKITKALEEAFKDQNLSLLDSSSVNPMNGRDFFVKCLIAVAFAAVLMILYIAVRFRKIGGLSAGVTAVIALVHDLIVVFAVFAIFRIEIGGNFMAVMLTILGYSINDTIVVFDRVRENKDIYGKKLSAAANINMSLNQCLDRAINTTVTTLMALAVVIVVSLICGINSMFDFIFPMAVGLVSGVYSSLCLAPNIWVNWVELSEKKKKSSKKK